MSDILTVLEGLKTGLTDGHTRTGSTVMIRCPFHGGGRERTPSMSIDVDKPVFYCFGCKEHGHLTALFRKLGASQEAARSLLRNAGYSNTESRPTENVFQNVLKVMPINSFGEKDEGDDSAEEWEGHQKEGQAYILPEDVLDPFRLLPTSLVDEGFESSTLYYFGVGVDQEEERITYPIRDYEGRLVGVSGRTYSASHIRYKIYKRELTSRRELGIPANYSLNSIKSHLLWNAHNAFKELDASTPLVVAEGFKAAMWIWQSGHKAVVALIGSYLSPFQAERICKSTGDVVLFLDNDEAGESGTLKAIPILLDKGVRVRVAVFPEGKKQPDDLTKDETQEAIRNAVNYIAWQMGEH